MLKQLRSKTLMTVSLIVVFLFSMTGTAFGYGGTTTSATSPPYDYMAVGDSIPWGYIPNSAIPPGDPVGVPPFNGMPGLSYADLIAFDVGVKLGSYTEYPNDTYTYPGMPTKALLAAMTPHRDGTEITMTINGETVTAPLPNYLSVMRDLRNSEIVTLTVGADDILFLPAVQSYLLKSKNGQATNADLYAAQVAVLKQLPKTGANLSLIIGIMKAANPKARIYVMGYYDAFPDNLAAQNIIKLLNATIKSSVNTYRYSPVAPKYIETWGPVTKDMLYYNAIYGYDIHVNPLGQQKIADLFLDKIKSDFGL
jgi:lysophospholipase L1-like esterase